MRACCLWSCLTEEVQAVLAQRRSRVTWGLLHAGPSLRTRGRTGFGCLTLTHHVASLVVLHDILAVEHLVADLAGIQLLTVLFLVFWQVAVCGEETRADLTLECLVICTHTQTHTVVNGTGPVLIFVKWVSFLRNAVRHSGLTCSTVVEF